MSLPTNHFAATPIAPACHCSVLSGAATSKFCPDCGRPRVCSAVTATSLSEQLRSPLSELSLATPVAVAGDVDYVSAPVVISADSWTVNNDPASLDIDAAATHSAQWRDTQPFNMRTVMLAATSVFTAFAFLFFATSRGGVKTRNTWASDNKTQLASQASESPLIAQPANAPIPVAATAVSSATAPTSNGNGALVSNAPARPRQANSARRSTPMPPLVNVEHEPQNEEIAPASISSLPRVAARAEPRETVEANVASDNGYTSRSAVTSVGASSRGPLRAIGARPTYVAVSPVDGAPDGLNPASAARSTVGRYSGRSGYMIINGRVVMDGAAPVITIQSPNSNGNYVGYFPSLQGFANSASGVGAVELEIERMASGGTQTTYWDGQDWTSGATRLAADVSNGVWSYSGALPGDDKLVAGYYRVKVYARGLRSPQGKTAPAATLRIRVFPEGPAE